MECGLYISASIATACESPHDPESVNHKQDTHDNKLAVTCESCVIVFLAGLPLGTAPGGSHDLPPSVERKQIVVHCSLFIAVSR